MHTGHSLAFTKMIFSSLVPQERFQSIIRFLHFGNESQQLDHGLTKMRFLINHLNNTMPGIYTSHEELSLDESIMLWRGQLLFRQYIKNRRHKYWVKFFELCTNDGWPCVEGPVVFWKKIQRYWVNWADRAYRLYLMEPYLNKDYHVVTENWHNSVSLTQHMSKKNTYITGNLHADWKRNSLKVIRKKLQKGEMVFMSLGDISVTKWEDKKDVNFNSNAHMPIMMDSANKHGKTKRNQKLLISTSTISWG